jgi:hypothetical protein
MVQSQFVQISELHARLELCDIGCVAPRIVKSADEKDEGIHSAEPDLNHRSLGYEAIPLAMPDHTAQIGATKH